MLLTVNWIWLYKHHSRLYFLTKHHQKSLLLRQVHPFCVSVLFSASKTTAVQPEQVPLSLRKIPSLMYLQGSFSDYNYQQEWNTSEHCWKKGVLSQKRPSFKLYLWTCLCHFSFLSWLGSDTFFLYLLRSMLKLFHICSNNEDKWLYFMPGIFLNSVSKTGLRKHFIKYCAFKNFLNSSIWLIHVKWDTIICAGRFAQKNMCTTIDTATGIVFLD